VTRSALIVTQKKHVTIDLAVRSTGVKSDILRTTKVNTDTFDNLTPVERTALQNLRSNEDIIIKPADKGSAVVVLSLPPWNQSVP
jgi:curli biogenesis system outer membrane secretion channel CsgG